MLGVVLCWKQSSILQASHEASPPLEDSQLERCRLGTWASKERTQCFCIQFKFWSKIEAPKLTRLLWSFHELDLHLEMHHMNCALQHMRCPPERGQGQLPAGAKWKNLQAGDFGLSWSPGLSGSNFPPRFARSKRSKGRGEAQGEKWPPF